MVRCLLVASYENPPRSFLKPQMGLIWLKKAVLDAGLAVHIEIVDPQVETPEHARRRIEEPWDVIGFYTTYPTLLNSIGLMNHAWSVHLDAPRDRPLLVGGGPGCAFGELLAMSPLDLAVSGEAEKLWVELLRRLIDARRPIAEQPLSVFADLPGNYMLRHRARDGSVAIRRYTAAKDASTLDAGELDRLLVPQPWELALHKPYIDWTRENLRHSYGFPIYATRGCSRPGCRFCSSFKLIDSKGGTRAPDPRTVSDAFRAAAGPPLHARSFILEDDTFVWKRAWMLDVCEYVSQAKMDGQLPAETSFIVKSRVDQFDEALVRTMVRAGFDQINVGVESGSPRVLRAVAKIANAASYLQKVDEIMGWIPRYGLRVHAYMIFFTPESTVEDLLLTVELGARLLSAGAEISTYETILALPGSPFERAWAQDAIVLESETVDNPMLFLTEQTAATAPEWFVHPELGRLPSSVRLPRTLLPSDPLMREVLDVSRRSFDANWVAFKERLGWRASTSARNGLVRLWTYVQTLRGLESDIVDPDRLDAVVAALDRTLAGLRAEPEELPENQSCSNEALMEA